MSAGEAGSRVHWLGAIALTPKPTAPSDTLFNHEDARAQTRWSSVKRRAVPRGLLRACAIVAAGGVLMAGCGQEVTPTTSEPTPPTLTWGVLDKSTHTLQNYPATATIAASPESSYSITLRAEDPGGVQHIEVGGGYDFGCASGNLGSQQSGLLVSYSYTAHANGAGKVSSYEVLLTSVDPSGWSCPGGQSFAGGQAAVTGRATNFSNRVAEGKLTIGRAK
jgi:hypothetical protein